MTTEATAAKTAPDEMRGDVVEWENAIREKTGEAYLQSQMDMDGAGGVWDSEFRAFVDAQTLKGLFFSELWVFLVVDLVAQKISAQQMRVMRGELIDGEFSEKPAEGHPLQNLIEAPNPFQSYEPWMYGSIVDLSLLGNLVQWYAAQSNYLMPLPGENVTLDLDSANRLTSYSVTELVGGSEKKVTAKFLVEDIVHARRPNPSSLLWGLSPFIPGRKSVLFNRYSSDYLNNFYQKSATPGLALSMDKEANERTALRLLRSFEAAYTGRRNQRRTLVLPKGVTAKEITHTIADQDFVNLVNLNREDIINILKVPKHELSLQDAGSLGSEEYKQALKNFWAATLMPMCRLVAGEFTRFFHRRGLLEKDLWLAFDTSDVEVLREDEKTKAELAEKMLKTHTLNEVRKKVYKLPPVDGGDVVVGYGKGIQQPILGGGGSLALPAAPAATQPAALALPAAPSAAPEVTESAVATSAKAAKDKLSNFLKGGDDWWTRRESAVREDAAKGVTAMERSLLKMFSDMAVAIIKTAKSHLKEKDWDALRTKADEPKAKLVGKPELRRRLRKALDTFEDRYVSDVRTALVARLDTGYGAALEVPFNMPSTSEIEAARRRGAAAREDALEERAGRMFSYMNETTVEQVYGVIDRGIDSGKTVQQIADDLRSKFSDIAEIGSRAMTIARTETLTAVSLGQAAAMKDAASVVPNLKKMWVSADDDRTRASHAELHGDVVAHDSAFANGLQFPRDPGGPAEEVINCRCTWIMVPADQMSDIDDSLSAEEES